MRADSKRSTKAADQNRAQKKHRPLDRVDRQILKLLQEDGRKTVSQLARQVHLTTTPCFYRVRRLEEDGYIAGYFAQLEPSLLGLGLLAYITVSLDQALPDMVRRRFTDSIRAHDEVLECHMVGGGWDYLLKVRVRDMDAYRRFLGDRLGGAKGVKGTHTFFVVEQVKSTHKIPLQG